MYSIQTLSTGLRVLTVPELSASSVTALVLVKAGSRYETFEHNGISHFLEHMFFKGAKDFVTPKDVSLAIDSIGGSFNAFTGKEVAGYYVKVAKEHADTAVHVLSDMLIHSTFPEEEIEKEKGVILEEINMYLDSPQRQIGSDFTSAHLGNQPLGWDIAGRPAWIKKATKEEFIAYKNKHYAPENSVLVLSGNITPKDALRLAEEYFGDYLKHADQEDFTPIDTALIGCERVQLRKKDTDQAHFILGSTSVSRTNPEKYAYKVLSTILGGNMSSRLFQNLREQRGLCYYVYTGNSTYHDTGAFYHGAGVSLAKINEAISAVQEEFAALSTIPITATELTNAKNYLAGTLALSLEDSEEKGYFLGQQLLLNNNIKEYEEVKQRYDAVSIDTILKAYEDLKQAPLTLSVVGPYEHSQFTSLI